MAGPLTGASHLKMDTEALEWLNEQEWMNDREQRSAFTERLIRQLMAAGRVPAEEVLVSKDEAMRAMGDD